MGKGERIKGFSYEREVVNQFKEAGLEAERHWGSDGRSKGLPQDVDLSMRPRPHYNQRHFQLKRKKVIASFLKPSEHLEGVILRADREESLIVIRLSRYIELIREGTGSPANPAS